MPKSFSRIIALAVVLGFPATVLTPMAYAQDPSCVPEVVSASSGPFPMVLPIKTTQTLTYTVTLSNSCGATGRLYIHSTYDSAFEPLVDELILVSAEDGLETYAASRSIDSTDLSTAYVGEWETRLVGRGLDTDGPPAQLVWQVRLNTHATPEPVDKGDKIMVTGKVRIAVWDMNRNKRAINAPVRLQFRTPDGNYRTIKRLTSGDRGDPKTTVTANRDGCFRFVFDPWSPDQDRWIKTRSRGDCVEVR
jgi:hypothetical protein